MNENETGLLIVTPIEIKKEELQQMASDYSSIVVSDSTFKTCDSIRKQFKAKRTKIQRIVDSRKTARLVWKHDEDAKDEKLANEFLAILTPIEKRLERELNAITERQKREAEERIRKEDERKRGIKNMIQVLKNQIMFVRKETDIKTLGQRADEISMERDSFEEFNEEGNRVIDTLIQAINNRNIVLEGEIEARKAEEEKPDFGNVRKWPKKEEKPDLNAFGNAVMSGIRHGQMDLPHTVFNPEPKTKTIIPGRFEEGAKHYPKTESSSFIYAGYNFVIDNTLPQENIEAIKKDIIEHVDQIAF